MLDRIRSLPPASLAVVLVILDGFARSTIGALGRSYFDLAMNPWLLMTWQFAIGASLVFWMLCVFRKDCVRNIPRAGMVLMALSSVLGVGVGMTGAMAAAKGAPVGIAGVVSGSALYSSVMLTTWLVEGVGPRLRQLCAVVCALAAVLLLGARSVGSDVLGAWCWFSLACGGLNGVNAVINRRAAQHVVAKQMVFLAGVGTLALSWTGVLVGDAITIPQSKAGAPGNPYILLVILIIMPWGWLAGIHALTLKMSATVKEGVTDTVALVVGVCIGAAFFKGPLDLPVAIACAVSITGTFLFASDPIACVDDTSRPARFLTRRRLVPAGSRQP